MKMSSRLLMVILCALASLVACDDDSDDIIAPNGDSPYVARGVLPLPSESFDATVKDGHAFVAGGQAGLHAVNLDDLDEPELVMTVDTIKEAFAIGVVSTVVEGQTYDICHISEGSEGLTSYDVTDPSNVYWFNSGTTAIEARKFFIREPADPNEAYFVYLAEDWKGVRIYEEVLGAPGFLNQYPFVYTHGLAQDVQVRDAYAFVADDQMGLTVLDVSDPQLGDEPVAWLDTPGNAVAIALGTEHAYIADTRKGLAVIEITDPLNPASTAQLALGGECVDVVLHADYALALVRDVGLCVVDISDPADPLLDSTLTCPDGNGLWVTDDGIVVVATDSDLRIFEYDQSR